MYKKIVFVGALLAGISAGAMELTVTPEVNDQVIIYLGEEENEITLPKKYAELMGILELVDDPAFVAKFRFPEVNLQGWKFIAAHLERLYEITHNAANADTLRQEIFTALSELEADDLKEVIHAADYLQMPFLLEIAFNGRDKDKCTLLHGAAQKGRLAVVTLLVGRHDVDVNVVDGIHGETPLHVAAYEGHLEVVKLLLGRDDIEVNAADSDGNTPLNCAAEKGHVEVVRLLLCREDILVNAADRFGSTPLGWAVQNSYLEVLKLLLDRDDIDVHTATKNGFTPLQWAADKGHVEVVKLLLGRDDIGVNVAGRSESTPFHWAARRGHVEVVKLLLGRDGIKVNTANSIGSTPLYSAAFNGHRDMCLYLLTYGLITKENRARGAQDILTEYTPMLNAIYSKLKEDNPVRALFSENTRGNILEMLKQGLADSDSLKQNINKNNDK